MKITNTKIYDTVKEVVGSKNYQNLYKTYPMNHSFNFKLEVKCLNQFIAVPNQQIHFKSKNFVLEGTKKCLI